MCENNKTLQGARQMISPVSSRRDNDYDNIKYLHVNVLSPDYGKEDPENYVIPFNIRPDSTVWDLNL